MITVRMAKYSVPARFINQKVRVSLRACELGNLRRQNLIVAGLTAALTGGAVTADVVVVEALRIAARRGHPDCHPPVPPVPAWQRVVRLTQRHLADPAAVIAGLPADIRAFRRWPRPAPETQTSDNLRNTALRADLMTPTSPVGRKPSPTHASAQRLSTVSPSGETSSKPAPIPTASPTPATKISGGRQRQGASP